MKDYKAYTIEKFSESISQKTQTPGGGAVAANVALLGASLLSMTSNFTKDKEEYKEHQDKIEYILNKLDYTKTILYDLMDEDAEAFEKLMKSFKNSKEEIQNNYKKCLQIPLELAQISLQLMEISIDLIKIGNKNLISDTMMGGLLSHSALKSSLLNVDINYKYITDEEYKEAVRNKVEKIKFKSERFINEIEQI